MVCLVCGKFSRNVAKKRRKDISTTSVILSQNPQWYVVCKLHYALQNEIFRVN